VLVQGVRIGFRDCLECESLTLLVILNLNSMLWLRKISLIPPRLSPKFDCSLREDLLADEIEEDGPEFATVDSAEGGLGMGLGGQRGMAKQSGHDEFRSFVGRLPELQFWLFSTRVTLIALHASYFGGQSPLNVGIALDRMEVLGRLVIQVLGTPVRTLHIYRRTGIFLRRS